MASPSRTMQLRTEGLSDKQFRQQVSSPQGTDLLKRKRNSQTEFSSLNL